MEKPADAGDAPPRPAAAAPKLTLPRPSPATAGADGSPRSSALGFARSPRLGASTLGAGSPSVSTPGGGALSSFLRNRGEGSSPRAAGASPLGASPFGASPAGSLSKPSFARSGTYGTRGLASLGTSYFLEKQAVVLDFGWGWTKVGFATESRPRHIFATPELRTLRRAGTDVSVSATHDQWVQILDRLVSKIFFHYLSVSPKDRRVVVCDSVHLPSQFRTALAHVLFRRLGVPSAAFVADAVLPLYLTGLSSGIVVDCGYDSSRVTVTFAGVPILSAYSGASPGARHVIAALRRGLKASLQEAVPTWLDDDDEAVEDIMVRACYVALDLPAGEGGARHTLKSSKAMTLIPPGRSSITVPADLRWQATEVFFGDPGVEVFGEDGCSLPEAFVSALERCPVDVRPAVVQNVVIVGGCATLRGMLPRLAVEIHQQLKSTPKFAALVGRLRFTPLDFAPVCAVWTGGAVYGALEGVKDYTAEEHMRGKLLPDWARDGFV